MVETDTLRIPLYQICVEGRLQCFQDLRAIRSRQVFLTERAALEPAGVARFLKSCTMATDGLFDLDPATLSKPKTKLLELCCTRGELLRTAHKAEREA